MRREFIGGRVPKMVKDAFVQEAETAGLTLTEHLEKVLLDRMNGNKDETSPNVTLEDLRRLIKEELHSNQAIPESQLPQPDEIPAEAAEPESEEESLPETKDVSYEEEDILEEEYFEDDPEEEEEEDFSDLLPESMAEALYPVVQQVWERTGDRYEGEPLDKEAVSSFLEDLAVELQSWEDDGYAPDFADPYEEYLPEKLTHELDQVINEAIRREGQYANPRTTMALIADLLNQRADQLYQEDRTIELLFDRSEYWHLDKMLEKENANRNRPFADLKGLILHLIGEKLIERGSGFWGPTDEGMVGLGQRLKGMAVTRK